MLFRGTETDCSEKATPTLATATAASNITAPKVDDIFSSAASPKSETATTAPVQDAPIATATKAPFDDLDDDFEGLEDAKEGSADDDFATISRSGLDDYNAVFDSSPPPSHAAKSESNLTSTSAAFGGESSFDFASLGSSTGGSTVGLGGSTTLVSQNGTATTSTSKAQAPDGHDWDAIFASLDDAAPSTASVETSKLPEKQAPGREESEHDDPILRNLTTMGYSRADAVNALEKYDYNLERVRHDPAYA